MKTTIGFIRSKAPFFFSFFLTKGIVFLTPLLLADILIHEDFGKLEYALAGLGFVLNALINLGVPGGYPYFLLKEKSVKVSNGFNMHLLWLSLMFFGNQIAYFLLGFGLELYMSFNVAFIIANQVFYSTRLKTNEKPIKAIFFDSGIYLLLLLLYLIFYWDLSAVSISTINLFLLGYASFYFILGIRKFLLGDKTEIIIQYRRILKYSISVMLGSFLIFLLTASGRILVEFFFTFEDVAGYAFYFRISAVAVMIYQMISILYYKKLYTYVPAKLDSFFSLFFLAMGMLSVALFFVAPYILELFSEFFNHTYAQYKGIYFLLSFQMVMWIATALNSSIVDRENLARKNNIWFLGLILISLGVLFLLQKKLDMILLVFVHMTVIFVAALIQYRSLNTKGIIFKKSIFALSFLYLAAAICFFTGILQ